MIKIFLADDHVVVRHGLRRLLEDTDDLQLVGETSRGREVLERAPLEGWDVLVLDLSLDDVGGIEILRRLRADVPALPVLVLSMYPESEYAVRILKMGAAGYLSKGRSSAELLEAIRTVASGRRYVTSTAADALLEAGPGRSVEPHERLSEREMQVFLLVARGKAPGDIAAELDISASTVSSHLAHIREKLGARTNGELLTYAFRAGLTPSRA